VTCRARCMTCSATNTEIVCLVDDDPAILTSIGRLLASEGFSVSPFEEPTAFLAHAAEHFVPLVILDVWMEPITGLEVQARLAKVSPRTRVIVMTGRRDPAVEHTAMECGAVAFFTKPFDDEQFLGTVRRALAFKA
jgi:two-component system, LuxR family, response regulator FixJ